MIDEAIRRYLVTELDIFFTPQNLVTESDASLKPAFWIFKDRPNLDQTVGSQPKYLKSVLLGIFNSDIDISK